MLLCPIGTSYRGPARLDSRHKGGGVVTHLIFAVNDWACGVPLPHVAEISRPLLTAPVPDAPPYVLGITTLRGVAMPVIDAGLLLQGKATKPTRFVRLIGDGRQVALAVSGVEGVEHLQVPDSPVPPLLEPELRFAETLGSRDERLFAMLSAIRLLRDHGRHAEE